MPPKANNQEDNSVYDHAGATNRHYRLAAWFIGPRAENTPMLQEFFRAIAKQNENARKSYQVSDPVRGIYLRLVGVITFWSLTFPQVFITKDIQNSKIFKKEKEKIRKTLLIISSKMAKHSIPFWSPRYNAHMTYDTSLPAILGYLSTTLFVSLRLPSICETRSFNLFLE